jgi:POT family proton-dependent oligopeptide transporter
MVDRGIFGTEIPASTLQSLPAIYVIALAPLFSWLWIALGRRGREPSTPVKFVLAIVQISLAFLVLVLGSALRPDDGKVALIWFALTFLLMVTGELCLAPVGMSMVTRLSPKRIVSTMMGSFMLAYAASSYISGLIARLTSATTAGGDIVDFDAALSTYSNVYTRIGLLALLVAAVLGGLTPLLVRLMRGADSRPA